MLKAFKRNQESHKSSPWKMDEFHHALEKFLDEKFHYQVNHLSESEFEALVASTVDSTVTDISKIFLQRLKHTAPKMLRDYRNIDRGFVTRNEARWHPGFNLLQMLIVISMESAEGITNDLYSKLEGESSHQLEALEELAVRGVRVANEILWLMKGGFADGAISRWRTLHEIAVTCTFLAEYDEETSEMYLASFDISSFKSAKHYREHAVAANLEPLEKDDFKEIESLKDKIISQYGAEMIHDWGWASKVLNKKKPSFYDLEKHVQLDHWRPWYKWSCDDLHANHLPSHALLAACESSEEFYYIAGRSNSGMYNPAHLLSQSLIYLITALVKVSPNLDRLAIIEMMCSLRDEISKTFLEQERITFQRYLKRKKNPFYKAVQKIQNFYRGVS